MLEKNELDAKLDKLLTFLTTKTFNDLAIEERVRLEKQAVIMHEYSSILGERIAAF